MDEIHENNNIGWKVLPLFDSTTDIDEIENLPAKFEISQNYPNPFNPVTTIKYSIPKEVKSDASTSSATKSNVKLIVYDILGRKIRTLVNEVQKAGNYEVEFDASELTSGVYFYKLHAGEFIKTKKMLLLK